jgi:hypothetical protein
MTKLQRVGVGLMITGVACIVNFNATRDYWMLAAWLLLQIVGGTLLQGDS